MRFGAEIVEEETTDTTGLRAMRDEEVLVAPFLERRIEDVTVLVARVLDRLVEVDCIFLVKIVWREIRASAEPPCQHLRLVLPVGDLEVTVVGVYGGSVWVPWVYDE